MVEDREILRLNGGINKLCYFFINLILKVQIFLFCQIAAIDSFS